VGAAQPVPVTGRDRACHGPQQGRSAVDDGHLGAIHARKPPEEAAGNAAGNPVMNISNVFEPIPVRWERPSQPVAGPVSAAVGSRQFAPLPGLVAVRQGRLREGGLGDLHAVYGGLGSGRMVIVGAPGWARAARLCCCSWRP
jgi:hypothetical protein